MILIDKEAYETKNLNAIVNEQIYKNKYTNQR